MYNICYSKYQCNNSNLILTKSMSKECKHINMSDIRLQPHTHIYRHSHISIITRFEYKNYIVNDFEWLVCISILHFYSTWFSLCIYVHFNGQEEERKTSVWYIFWYFAMEYMWLYVMSFQRENYTFFVAIGYAIAT